MNMLEMAKQIGRHGILYPLVGFGFMNILFALVQYAGGMIGLLMAFGGLYLIGRGLVEFK